jgi:hypothetical protein
MRHLLKTWLFAALSISAFVTHAQKPDSLLLFDGGRPLPYLRGLVVNSGTELLKVSQSLRESSYPIILLPDESVRSTVNTFNAKDRLILTIKEENRLLSHRDTLSMLESRKLNDIISVHQRHISLCDSTNLLLNRSIMGLNTQLDETRQLAKDCNKMRTAKSVWATVLGGGIGFGLGILLGVVLN